MKNTEEQKKNTKKYYVQLYTNIWQKKKTSELDHFLRKINFQNWLKESEIKSSTKWNSNALAVKGKICKTFTI